jgi:hypothetical protein
MDLPQTFNSLIYATVQPTQVTFLEENLDILRDRDGVHPLLLEAIERVVNNLQPTPEGGTVFTDEHAPIEWITNDMILRFILSEDMEELQ